MEGRVPKSKVALVVWLLLEIETALANGHSYTDCIQMLETRGLKFTHNAFKKVLQRARQMQAARKALIAGNVSSGNLQTQSGASVAERITRPTSDDSASQVKEKMEKANQDNRAGKVNVRYVGGIRVIEFGLSRLRSQTLTSIRYRTCVILFDAACN